MESPIQETNRKKIILLGCTGSIGKSCLQVVRRYPERFEIRGLSAHSRSRELARLAEEFSVPATVLTSKKPQGIQELLQKTSADLVVNGIAGASGLEPSVWALEAGMDLALANKETLVMAGPLIQELARRRGCNLLPVDSEHSALFFLTQNRDPSTVSEIILTASGGPFREKKGEEIDQAAPEDALKHPTWSMGRKISIDSASMANKGLEVIEAARLFPVSPEQIRVAVHPQSQVHSLIRTTDGALYAQISLPSMELPLQNAMTWPELAPLPPAYLDLTQTTLTFEEPDVHRFPMLSLAYQALERGDAGPVVYNAANEIAVSAFVDRRIRFGGISELTRRSLEADFQLDDPGSLDSILNLDRRVRQTALSLVKELPLP